MPDKLFIIGCGGHARSVADIVLDNEPDTEIVFVDSNAHPKETLFGFHVIKDLPKEAKNIFVAIGDNSKRSEVMTGIEPTTIISKRAYIGKDAIIEAGCLIANGVFIGSQSRIGKGSIVNTNAVIEHECNIGEYCHIAPNSSICGRCQISNNVFLGVGSAVKEKIKIGKNITIGAGGVVVKDLQEQGIYVGVPVKKIK